MESTERMGGPAAGGAEPVSGEQAPSAGDRECSQCLAYLTRALDRAGSRPQSLLKALGVIPPDENGNNNTSNLYERTEDGRGLLIRLENKGKLTTSDEGLMAGRDDGRDLHGRERPLEQLPLEDAPSSSPSETKPESSSDGSVTLGRRFTNAATLLADGIRHSAEDILNNEGMGGVLTTSPAAEAATSDPVAAAQHKHATTIAVECQTCGSDTRAEAGARAFVRGPEPLSIVLCANRLSSQREVDEVLVHELVHIYDVHSREMDLRDCRQLAYSEVRAAREAECSNSLTSFTRNICAKDKATVATRNMFPDQGRRCVCDVFNEAVNDLAPFAADDGKGGAFLRAGCDNGSDATSYAGQQTDHATNFAPPGQPFPTPRRSDR